MNETKKTVNEVKGNLKTENEVKETARAGATGEPPAVKQENRSVREILKLQPDAFYDRGKYQLPPWYEYDDNSDFIGECRECGARGVMNSLCPCGLGDPFKSDAYYFNANEEMEREEEDLWDQYEPKWINGVKCDKRGKPMTK